MRGAALVCIGVLACSQSGGASADAGAPDAAVDADRFPGCTDGNPDAVSMIGEIGDIDTGCVAVVPHAFDVCWLGHPQCVTADLLSIYRMTGLPNDEIALVMTHPGSVPRIEPFHPYGCTFQAFAFALPTPAITASILAPIGGLDPKKAYFVAYAEGNDATKKPNELCSANVAGFSFKSDRGPTYYMDATGLAIDSTATATTKSGLAIIAIDGAPDLSKPETIRVTAHGEGTPANCRFTNGLGWARSTPSATDFATDAPAVAGYWTYAMYLACH